MAIKHILARTSCSLMGAANVIAHGSASLSATRRTRFALLGASSFVVLGSGQALAERCVTDIATTSANVIDSVTPLFGDAVTSVAFNPVFGTALTEATLNPDVVNVIAGGFATVDIPDLIIVDPPPFGVLVDPFQRLCSAKL